MVTVADSQEVVIGTLHRLTEDVVRVIVIEEDDRLAVLPGINSVGGDTRHRVLGLPPRAVVTALIVNAVILLAPLPFRYSLTVR